MEIANSKRIMCVGMCVLDIIHVCEHYPQEDTDRRCLNGYWQRGGNASNNSTVLRLLGAKCEFLGMLSASTAFGFLLEDCHKRGIVIDNCPYTDADPPFSSVILTQSTDTRTIIHSNPNFPILTYEHFKSIDLNAYGWIHFEARNPEETLRMIRDIRKFNEVHVDKIKISVELEKMKTENFVLAELADYVFIGKDLAMFLGWNEIRAAVLGLRAVLKAQPEMRNQKPAIICTWGSKGCGCLDENDQYVFVDPVSPEKIVDSLGAGDTFCAATIFALLVLQRELDKAVKFGNAVAAFKLEHRGYDAIKEIDLPKM